jgi:hypothetical protein
VLNVGDASFVALDHQAVEAFEHGCFASRAGASEWIEDGPTRRHDQAQIVSDQIDRLDGRMRLDMRVVLLAVLMPRAVIQR